MDSPSWSTGMENPNTGGEISGTTCLMVSNSRSCLTTATAHFLPRASRNTAPPAKAEWIIGGFGYIAWVKCPYRVAGKVSALRAGKAGARLNARTELRAKRQRSAREEIYRNWPIQLNSGKVDRGPTQGGVARVCGAPMLDDTHQRLHQARD